MRDIDALAGAICASRPPEVAEGLPLHVDDECRALAGRVITALNESGFAIVDQEAALRAGGSLDDLLNALWQCGVESGMDTDGDDGPGAMVAGMGVTGFAAAMIESVRRLREDYGECLAEVAPALRGPQATEPTGSATTSIDLREGET